MSGYEKLLAKLSREEKQPVQQEPTSNFTRIPTLEIKKAGTYRLRLLPNKKDPFDLPFEKYGLHFGISNPNFGGKAPPLVCAGKNVCQACIDAVIQIKADPQNAWKYGAKDRWVYYAIYAPDNGEEHLVILSLNFYQQEKMRAKIEAQAKSKILIMDIQEGHWIDFSLNIVEDGNKKKYVYNIAVDTAPDRVDAELRALFNKQKPLDKIYDNLKYSVEDIKKIMAGEKTTQTNNTRTANTNTRTQTNKKVEPPQMKFASDEVEEVGGEEVDVESNFLEEEPEDAPDNMRRLSAIMEDEDDE